jgi:hypothetical protein
VWFDYSLYREKVSLSRCILVTNRGIDNDDLKILTIPPGSKYKNSNSVYIIQLDSSSLTVPTGFGMMISNI